MPKTTAEPAQSPTGAQVLTLQEAADYLRVSEEAVVAAVQQQGLPGRQVQGEWRFLKAAIEDWLSHPATQKERIARFAGAWKDDPYADEMLNQIYHDRGRPVTPESD